MDSQRPSANAKPIILLVDDNPDNLGVLFQTLEPDFGEDCELLIAQSGEEAIETVSKVVPSLILLDIMRRVEGSNPNPSRPKLLSSSCQP